MTLLDSTSPTPTFEATELGSWQINMLVGDGERSSSDIVTISVIEATEEDEEAKQSCNQGGFNSTNLLLLSLIPLLSKRRRD